MQEQLQAAVENLRNGKVILYPTDTGWAIGCDVRNAEAVEQIHLLKKREPRQPLVILIAQIEQLHDYVQRIPEIAWDIVEFAEKPLTIIYPIGKNVATGILGQDGSIAIRLVKDEFCRKLIQKLGRAIVYTSASIHKQAKPAHLADVHPDIKDKVDYVVNSTAPATNNKPTLSTIMRLEVNGQIKFYRK
jgi:L-threonylcarbamoyladenylate synthase